MHRPLLLLLTLVLAGGACARAVPAPPPDAAPDAAPAPPGLTRHVVVFRFRPGTRPEQIQEVTQAFGALRSQIPGIVAFEHGVNHSPEGRNLDFTHVYLLTFTSPEARDAYLPHPAHQAFGQLLGRLGVVEGVFVVDYTPER